MAEGSSRRLEESQIIFFIFYDYFPKVSNKTFLLSSSMCSVTIIIISVVRPRSRFIFVNKCSKGKGEIQAEFFRQTKPAFFKTFMERVTAYFSPLIFSFNSGKEMAVFCPKIRNILLE